MRVIKAREMLSMGMPRHRVISAAMKEWGLNAGAAGRIVLEAERLIVDSIDVADMEARRIREIDFLEHLRAMAMSRKSKRTVRSKGEVYTEEYADPDFNAALRASNQIAQLTGINIEQMAAADGAATLGRMLIEATHATGIIDLIPEKPPLPRELASPVKLVK